MAQAIWKGAISFGLVGIPVILRPGENRKGLDLTMIDKRDHSPVGYRKINKKTGRDVAKEDIVKGYEVEEGRFVVLSDEELKRVAVEKTQRIDIDAFIDAHEIDPSYFDRPYYLEPAPKSDKAYALLREALKRSKKIGIASVVIRNREYLAAVIPREKLLLLNLLRYSYELRDPEELKLPASDLKKLKITEAEMKMAERLIGDLESKWDPSRYKDRYHEDLLEFINKKAKAGETEAVELPTERPSAMHPPADIMKLLKESVERVEERSRSHGRGKALH